MFKPALFALSLTASSITIIPSAMAQPSAAKTEAAPVDPVRLKLAEQTVAKLIPPGTYAKIMKDMMDSMAGGLVEQMMGMDAAVLAGMAGEEAGSQTAEAVKGKTMGDLAGERDPAFKERMDITMKVMFAEMGTLMSEMEPVVRTAMSSIYARKYSAKELTDMNKFFATPSGATFAGNFMATFTDKEMMQASFGMMPKVMEAMPAIMKKVEQATAHLPPMPKSADETAIDAALAEMDSAVDSASGTDAAYADETGEEPWYSEDNWKPADRKRAAKLSTAYDSASEKSETAYASLSETRERAIDETRKRFLADGWKPAPIDGSTAADAAPPTDSTE